MPGIVSACRNVIWQCFVVEEINLRIHALCAHGARYFFARFEWIILGFYRSGIQAAAKDVKLCKVYLFCRWGSPLPCVLLTRKVFFVFVGVRNLRLCAKLQNCVQFPWAGSYPSRSECLKGKYVPSWINHQFWLKRHRKTQKVGNILTKSSVKLTAKLSVR